MKILLLCLMCTVLQRLLEVAGEDGVGSGGETGSPLYKYHLHFLGHIQVLAVQLFTLFFLQSDSFLN